MGNVNVVSLFTIQPRGKLGIKVPYNKDENLQGIGITAGYHISSGDEGVAVKINTNSEDSPT